MKSSLVEIFRRNAADTRPFEIKDPSIVPLPDKTYMMYATIFGPGIPKKDIIGRFHAAQPEGPWRQMESATVHGITGPEICAPQVLLGEENGAPLWTMYVQTSCFKPDGVIAVATSHNGIDFYAHPAPVLTRDDVQPQSVISLYDVSVSDISLAGTDYECMVFSGYRHIGCGDLYMSLRRKDCPGGPWDKPQLILAQEDMPFHNRPGSANFEWGLEGAKIVQLAEDSFLLAGVCFLDKNPDEHGTRQRVFFAAAKHPSGPFDLHTLPIEPTPYDIGTGENGHPDIILQDDRLIMLYQERAGDRKPWHLRYAEIPKNDIGSILGKPMPSPSP